MARHIYLHAGAHRTGTSSFQMCLSANRALLEARGFGVAHPGRDGVTGSNLKLRLPAPRHGAGQRAKILHVARQGLAQASPDASRPLILSEENIPGRMMHFYHGKMYPASQVRFETLAQVLEEPPEHLLYVIRPYAQLFVSAYRKRAEEIPVEPFEALIPRLMQMDRGWPAMLAEMQAILQPRRMTVVDYRNRGSSVALLARLVPGLEADQLVEPQATLNLSATDTALAALQARYHAGEKLTRIEQVRIISEHTDNTSKLGFAEFPADQAATLDERYAADITQIAEMPDVTFV